MIFLVRQNLKLQLCSKRNYVPEYNKRKTGWILRKANGYLARNPNFFNNFIVYGFTGFMAGYWFYNSYQEKQIKKTMTEEEYIMYREKKKALNEQRMKYGTDLYIPFLTKKVENERIDEIYYKS